MKLFNFLKKHGKGPSAKQYFFALVLTQDYVGAALWLIRNHTVDVVSKATVPYYGDWNERIQAADRALTEAAETISEEEAVDQVIFGLAHQYVKEEQITPDYLKGLKKLCQELSLTPAGFVVIPEAIAYFLAQREGSPLSAILVGVEKSSLIVSIFKVGKTIGMMTIPRSESIAADLEEAIKEFSDVEVMPSKILLYNGEKTLTHLCQELLSYPWQKKKSFLHFPKVDSLEPGTALEAVAVAGASELGSLQKPTAVVDEQTGVKEQLSAGVQSSQQRSEAEKGKQEKVQVESSVSDQKSKESSTSDEQLVDAARFGFVKDTDIAHTKPAEVEQKRLAQPRMEVVVTPQPEKPSRFFGRLLNIRFPQLSIPTLNIGRWVNTRLVLIGLAVGIFLAGSLVVSAYWTYPAATVKLLVDPQVLTREIEVILDPTIETVDKIDSRIPAKIVENEVKGVKTLATTGEKTIGEPARGEVTVYNKTTSEKTFPKRTTLIGPKGLRFSLDESITVASMSDVIVGTPGKQIAKITAGSIGSDSNLPAGSDFSFKDFPVTSYAARNERALTGGTSRQVQAVSQEDQEQLLSTLHQELKNQAKTQLASTLQAGEYFVEESIVTTVINKEFSHAVGDNADELTLNATLGIKGVAYRREDIVALVEREFTSEMPENFSFDRQNVDIDIIKTTVDDDQMVRATFKVTSRFIPNIPVDEVRKELTGKSLANAEDYLRGVKGIAGFEVNFTKQLPFAPRRLPNLLSNLTLQVEPR